MVPRVSAMCFWPAKTRKIPELFEMHTCLRPGAQIWLRRKWRKLVATSSLLICIVGYSFLRYWNEFFSAVVHVLDWSFLVMHFYGNVCNWIPEVIWPRMDWFLGFCRIMPHFVHFIFAWTELCMNCQFVILFWRHQIFSMFRLSGNLVCFLKMLVLFAIGFCNIDW